MQENKAIIRIKHILKKTRFSILFNRKRFKGTVVNLQHCLLSMENSLKLCLQSLSIKIGNRNMKLLKSKQNFVLKGIESLPQIQMF